MRQIDTAALAAVARSLGVGNPATATQAVEFDDDNLQQSLDVGPTVRYAAALKGPDGWMQGNMQMLATGVAYHSTTVNIFDLFDLPDDQSRRGTLWVYGISLFLDTSIGFLDYGQALLQASLTPSGRFGAAAGPQSILLSAWDSSTGPFGISATDGWAFPAWQHQFPVALPAGTSMFFVGENVGAAGNVSYELSVLARLTPPGVPSF